MTTIKIDEKDYEVDLLSDDTKNNIQMLQITEQEIQRLNIQLAIAQTARIAYANAVQAGLPADGSEDTIKF